MLIISFIEKYKEVIMVIISSITMFISVCIHRETVLRDCKYQTLKKLSEIRTEYRDFAQMSSEKKKRYIQELEFLAIGVEERIYDLEIIKKMSRKKLVSQYDNYIKEFLNDNFNECDYTEYKKMIENIRYI